MSSELVHVARIGDGEYIVDDEIVHVGEVMFFLPLNTFRFRTSGNPSSIFVSDTMSWIDYMPLRVRGTGPWAPEQYHARACAQHIDPTEFDGTYLTHIKLIQCDGALDTHQCSKQHQSKHVVLSLCKVEGKPLRSGPGVGVRTPVCTLTGCAHAAPPMFQPNGIPAVACS